MRTFIVITGGITTGNLIAFGVLYNLPTVWISGIVIFFSFLGYMYCTYKWFIKKIEDIMDSPLENKD